MKTHELRNLSWQEFKPGHFFCGVDEVGRGCLAGPVVAAAVVFKSGSDISEYRDSKTLSESRREELSERIISNHFAAVGIATLEEIEQLNILWASQLAMVRALKDLNVQLSKLAVSYDSQSEAVIPKKTAAKTSDEVHSGTKKSIAKISHVYVDGHLLLKEWKSSPQSAIVSGDQHLRLIGAASIVAKVYRDRLLNEMSKEFPQYGFEKNKGYGAPKHLAALSEFGPCMYHRKSFKGVREFFVQGSKT